jgi:hypothetical protein
MQSRMTLRSLSWASALIAGTLGLGGCGGTAGIPRGAVAQVQGRAISKAMLDHWVSLEAVARYADRPTEPLPSGLVPDPPLYRHCIDYLRRSRPKLIKGHRPLTEAQLKASCESYDRALRDRALSVVITFQWLIGEAAKRGIRVSGQEVAQRLTRFNEEKYPGRGELQRVEGISDETLADERLRVRINMLSTRLEEQVARSGEGAAGRQRVLTRFFKEFPRKWAAKTNCRAGYIVPNCRQFKGPTPPEPLL